MPQKLPARSKRCFITKRSFDPGDQYVSQLIYVNDQWERRDYTPDGWASVQDKGEFWHGYLPTKKKIEKETSLLSLFIKRHAIDPLSAVVFLLALYLERERVLVYRSSLAKAPTRCYEELVSGELFCVTPVALSEYEKQETLKELNYVLTHVEATV